MIWSPSLQNLAERLRRLPDLFVADVSIARGGADIFVAEELLDFPQVLSDVVEVVAAEWRRLWAVISSTPSARQAAHNRRLNGRFENGAPKYPANTNCDLALLSLTAACPLLVRV